MLHVYPRNALAGRLPFVMRDTSLRPVACPGQAFRELRPATLTARTSWTRAGPVKPDKTS